MNSTNRILVQYCPFTTTIGRYAFCYQDSEKFLNEFIEINKASDPFCKYIVMILDNWDCKTPNEIREACRKTILELNKKSGDEISYE